MRENVVWHLAQDFSTLGQWSHPLLNDVHSLVATETGLLLTSTGIDAILEFSLTGRLAWSWLASEHGFDRTPLGEPAVRRCDIDYRSTDIPTLLQSTHVNSAQLTASGTILATLFHQGWVVEIERSGAWNVVVEDLKQPHWIRHASFGWCIADTLGRRLVLLNGRAEIIGEIPVRSSWVADAVFLHETQTFLVLELDGPSIVEVNRRGDIICQQELNPDWKGFAIERVPLT
jgi:hypothetical protein